MRRKRRSTNLLAVGSLMLLGFVQTAPAQAAFPDVCKIQFDGRGAAEMAQRTDGQVALHELLGRVASVEVAGESSAELVLFVFRMRYDRTLERYVSPPFEATGGRSFPLREVLAAGEPDFGTFRFDPEHIIEATKAVPADAAVEQPGRFLVNGVIPYHPKGWEERDAFYVAAVPANSRLRQRSAVRIGVIFSAER